MIVLIRRRVIVLVVLASLSLFSGCSSRSTTVSSGAESQQGGIASQCDFTHREAIDPIRFPQGDVASHLHDFFGAAGVRSALSVDYLFAQVRTCDASGDHSSYWVPTLFEGDQVVAPLSMAVYVMTPHGVDPDVVALPPNGLQMVTFTSAWRCSREGQTTPRPQQCPANANTRLQLEFPNCWDGKETAFHEERPHVVATDSVCPSTHPVVLPRIVMEVRYKISAVDAVRFSSGDVRTVHGDVFFVWDQQSLERDFDACLRRNIMCGVTWSTELGV